MARMVLRSHLESCRSMAFHSGVPYFEENAREQKIHWATREKAPDALSTRSTMSETIDDTGAIATGSKQRSKT
ncbi:hypothetical protein KIN20_015932 [Parelaphostrongylus tenuis]|uniref:Uncharacterized protein n=1 Tax=Parelaphostrongylus tenuis TaxID=148309 RepID=A0AAD5QQE0_PARTN|nr:hypothetical protein KIN20_015932 [Parelaphostrongylus tenuis]